MTNSTHYYDAMSIREDLNFKNNKRVLYTKLSDIEEFNVAYEESELTLNRVLREKLHTAIVVNQKENILESMDGTRFMLQTNVSATELTQIVVSHISQMHYGAAEVKKLKENLQ